MKKLNATPFALLIVLGMFAQSATAQDPPPVPPAPPMQGMPQGHGGGMHDMMPPHMKGMHGPGLREEVGYADIVIKYANELKLTDEQIGKITRIQQSSRDEMQKFAPKMLESHKAVHELFLNPASDDAAIRAASKERNKVSDELLEMKLKSRDDINKILTPEQLKQLQSKKVEK